MKFQEVVPRTWAGLKSIVDLAGEILLRRCNKKITPLNLYQSRLSVVFALDSCELLWHMTTEWVVADEIGDVHNVTIRK